MVLAVRLSKSPQHIFVLTAAHPFTPILTSVLTTPLVSLRHSQPKERSGVLVTILSLNPSTKLLHSVILFQCSLT